MNTHTLLTPDAFLETAKILGAKRAEHNRIESEQREAEALAMRKTELINTAADRFGLAIELEDVEVFDSQSPATAKLTEGVTVQVYEGRYGLRFSRKFPDCEHWQSQVFELYRGDSVQGQQEQVGIWLASELGVCTYCKREAELLTNPIESEQRHRPTVEQRLTEAIRELIREERENA